VEGTRPEKRREKHKKNKKNETKKEKGVGLLRAAANCQEAE
jgi:hypothetical protein